ncbi:MAG: DNA replication/repair protein RecF [Candidatus Sumerlaeota bacterium]|nr:DNA replication/repair protein RecF [Candidatus Sumerlaeota bacterium]
MLLRELRARRFRNLREIDLRFPDGPVLFWGDNAQGKTNLLEAIYFLATGRSFRSRNDRECVAWDAPPDEAASVAGQIERADARREIRVVLYQGEKRLFLDGKPLARLAELFGELNAVLFTPADLQIIQGGPSARRRFLDLELSQISPAYLAALQRYNQALRHRNALLRGGRPLERIALDLAPYEAIMAEAAGEILRHRAAALEDLGRRAARAHAEFGAGERLEISYRHFMRNDGADAREDVVEKYRSRLEADRADDLRQGATRSGPHRDDFLLTLDGRSAQDFASQGQQRSCALALRIAEVGLMEARRGEAPLLLLDDVGSELDAGRRTD